MKISDDGTRLEIESKPWLIGKIFAWLFLFLGVILPLIFVVSPFIPPRRGQIDCDRAVCHLVFSAWKKDVAPAEIRRAKLRHYHGGRNSTASNMLVLEMKSGPELELSESSYHATLDAEYRAVADGLNQFLAGGSELHQSYRGSDTDYWGLLPGVILCPIMAWLFLRLWIVRKIEIDRAARLVRLRIQRKFHAETEETFAFREIEGLSLGGYNWANLQMRTARGYRQLLFFPYTPEGKSQLQTLAHKLPDALGVPLRIDDSIRQRWKLESV